MRLAWLVLLNAMTTVVLLLALEGVSRLVRPVDFPDPLISAIRVKGNWSETRRYDPLLFWTMHPVADGEERMINSLGLRGAEIPPKGPREFRVLSLGESSTYARRVPFDETYSSRLESLLGPINGGPLRVVNAGVPGYTLFQGVVYLRHRGLALEPDAVMTYFGYNDFLPVAFRIKRDAMAKSPGLTDRELFEQRRGLRYRLVYALQNYSNIVRMISFSSGRPEGLARVDRSRPRVPEVDRRRLLGELRDLCREHGLQLVVVIPWYREFERHVPLLRELASADDLILVDLPERLAELPNPRASYFMDKMHPNSEGHRLIAAAIADELRRSQGSFAGSVPSHGAR